MKRFSAWSLQLFSVLFTVSLMFLLLLFCNSSAQQHISFPDDFTSIHPARMAGNNFLWTLMTPYDAVGQTCRYGFFHGSTDQEDNTWWWSRLQVLFLACLAFPFSFPSVFSLRGAWWRKKKFQNDSKTRQKKEKVMFMALAVFLLAFIFSTCDIYCCYLVDS